MGFKVISNGWAGASYILVRLWVAHKMTKCKLLSTRYYQKLNNCSNMHWVGELEKTRRRRRQKRYKSAYLTIIRHALHECFSFCTFRSRFMRREMNSFYYKVHSPWLQIHSTQSILTTMPNTRLKKKQNKTKIIVPNLKTSTDLSFDSSLGFNLSSVWAMRESGWTKHEW